MEKEDIINDRMSNLMDDDIWTNMGVDGEVEYLTLDYE